MARVSYAETTDADLLSRTREDPEAFGAFYDRHEATLLAFFWRATRRADLAADLTAETFAQALASARRFSPARGTPKAWLFGIARHQLADTWERGRVEDQARRRLGVEPLALSDETLERIESLGSRSGPEVLELLAFLPADQRRAVQGRVLEERDYHELARTLDCSESVVRQRVSRGLRSLRERLEQIG
jgi:RNA polymerase sigma factor (sigma-70 family)